MITLKGFWASGELWFWGAGVQGNHEPQGSAQTLPSARWIAPLSPLVQREGGGSAFERGVWVSVRWTG